MVISIAHVSKTILEIKTVAISIQVARTSKHLIWKWQALIGQGIIDIRLGVPIETTVANLSSTYAMSPKE